MAFHSALACGRLVPASRLWLSQASGHPWPPHGRCSTKCASATAAMSWSEAEGVICTLRIILSIPERYSPAGTILQAGLLAVIFVFCIHDDLALIKVAISSQLKGSILSYRVCPVGTPDNLCHSVRMKTAKMNSWQGGVQKNPAANEGSEKCREVGTGIDGALPGHRWCGNCEHHDHQHREVGEEIARRHVSWIGKGGGKPARSCGQFRG
uniref:Uncharacterized protein n=1 Tax=Oryza barthii TaxID=65489 RepID=A0A0D3FTZ6_9ORYZ